MTEPMTLAGPHLACPYGCDSEIVNSEADHWWCPRCCRSAPLQVVALSAFERGAASSQARIAELDGRRREGRALLHRMVKYVTEDRAVTPRATRLARLTDQVRDYLNRTRDPKDILR